VNREKLRLKIHACEILHSFMQDKYGHGVVVFGIAIFFFFKKKYFLESAMLPFIKAFLFFGKNSGREGKKFLEKERHRG